MTHGHFVFSPPATLVGFALLLVGYHPIDVDGDELERSQHTPQVRGVAGFTGASKGFNEIKRR